VLSVRAPLFAHSRSQALAEHHVQPKGRARDQTTHPMQRAGDIALRVVDQVVQTVTAQGE
jgi:hypothetical protein